MSQIKTRPGTEPSGAQAGIPTRVALVKDLSRLAPADWVLLVTAIQGAATYVSRQGTVAEQVVELIRWAESPTGPGITAIERAFSDLHGSTGSLETAQAALPFWSVPHYLRNGFFTGRDEVVAEIRQRFNRSRKAALALAISGLGGMGKTQTAVEYAYRYRDKYQAVVWLDAESLLALKTGCGKIARLLRLRYPENDLDQAALALKQWLATNKGWLLIFDNADDLDVLKPFLADAKHGHVLVTSRAQDFQDLGIINPVRLEQWPIEEATAFLLKRCGRDDANAQERDAAAQLARELDGLPLALEQAAAYIAGGHGLTFRRFLESYRSEGLRRLEARRPALGEYPQSVVSTWAANFAAVARESPAAADVLRLSAFLAPDAIPFELLARGAPELGPEVGSALSRSDSAPLLVLDLLHPLGRFSLVGIDGDAETYTIHRVVQEVLKTAMEDRTRRLWVERGVRAVRRAFPAVEYANWPSCGRLLPHALAVASSTQRGGMEFQDVALIIHQIAFYLYERGQYGEAEPLLCRAMEIRHAALGEGHPDYAVSLNNLAGLYRAMGRHAEAEPLLRRAMEIRRTALGEGHPDYAVSLNNLAGLYVAMGRPEEAEPIYLRAVEVLRASLGETDPTYAISLNDLAMLYCAGERYAEAEPLYLRAMEIRGTALGEEHPDYAASLNNLAGLYEAMGRHRDAEPLFLRTKEILRKALGEGHPHYAQSLTNVATLFRATERHGEAEPLLLQAIQIRRQALGEGHPDYATSLNDLAALYREMGRHSEAELLFLQAMQIVHAALGERHSHYATLLNNLATFYVATGRRDAADRRYRQAIAIFRTTLGTSHPIYRMVLGNYLTNQQELGLPITEGELLAQGLEDLPASPPVAREGDAEPNASRA